MGRGEASSKKTYTMEQWEAKLAQVKPLKEDMNKLIMNYLVTEGHVEAADMFAKESGTAPGIDLSSITERMLIRKALQAGDIEQAIDKVNDLNPEILESQHELYFHLQQQRLIELIRQGKAEEALEFAQEYLAPHGEEHPALLEELERTVALLAFEDSESSPVGALMGAAQRHKTASELNSALLSSAGQEREPRLPMLLKLMVWAQGQLDERASFPHIDNMATGVLSEVKLE